MSTVYLPTINTCTFNVTRRDLVRLVANIADPVPGPVPTVGERVDGLAGIVERGQTGALGLSGAPPLQRRWQGGRPLVGHTQTLPFQRAHLLAFGLWLVGIRLLD